MLVITRGLYPIIFHKIPLNHHFPVVFPMAFPLVFLWLSPRHCLTIWVYLPLRKEARACQGMPPGEEPRTATCHQSGRGRAVREEYKGSPQTIYGSHVSDIVCIPIVYTYSSSPSSFSFNHELLVTIHMQIKII